MESLYLEIEQNGAASQPRPTSLEGRSFSLQQLVSFVEQLQRTSSTRSKANILARLYSSATETLGKAELVRMFSHLSLLLSYVSEYEISNYLPKPLADTESATDLATPCKILIDEEDPFAEIAKEMVGALAEADLIPPGEPKPAGGLVVMDKFNIQIPTVKGVSVNPMNENRVAVEPKKVISEEELQRLAEEKEQRLARKVFNGLSQALFLFQNKLHRSKGSDAKEDADEILRNVFVEWICSTVPSLVDPLCNLFHFKFFAPAGTFNEESKKGYKPVSMAPMGIEMDKSDLWGSVVPWAVDLMLVEKRSMWKMLYNCPVLALLRNCPVIDSHLYSLQLMRMAIA